jgi:hypothetical protein
MVVASSNRYSVFLAAVAFIFWSPVAMSLPYGRKRLERIQRTDFLIRVTFTQEQKRYAAFMHFCCLKL